MLNRRDFLKSMAVASAGVALTPGEILGKESFVGGMAAAKPRGEKVKIAFVGIGNRGEQIINDFTKTGMIDVVALCDVDIDGPQCKKVLAPDVRQVR